jgi:membrane protease YdiL (CAAX protease family)
MGRQVVLLGGGAVLAAALRALLHPDDRITEVDELEDWPWERNADIDAVVVDLPVDFQMSAVEGIRVDYHGRLVVVLNSSDEHAAFHAEHDCVVVRRPIDMAQLSALLTTDPFDPSGRTAPPHQPAAAIHPGRREASPAPEAVPPGRELTGTGLVRHLAEPTGRTRPSSAASGLAAVAASTGGLAPSASADPAARRLSVAFGPVALAGTSLLLAYLGAVAVSELAWRPLSISVLASAAGHGLLALLLCLGLRVTADARTAALLPPLVAISTVRLITFAALPVLGHPLLRLVVVGVPALVAVAMSARLRSPGWRLLRPRRGGWRGQLLVTLLGIPLALLVWVLAPPAGQVATGVSTVVAAAVLVFAALPDELLYRGLLVPASVGVAGGWGLPLSSLVYALAYLPGGSLRTVLLAFLLGMALGWCRQRTGSVIGVVAAHGLVNVLVYLTLPLSGS